MSSKEQRTKGSLTQQRAQNKRISDATGENIEVCSKEHRTKGSLTPQVRTRGVQQRAENKRISHATGENMRCAAKSREQKDLSRHR